MIYSQVLGNIREFHIEDRQVENVYLEWDDINKRILRKTTDKGREIGLTINTGKPFQDGDVIYIDDQTIVVLRMTETDVISVRPQDITEMGHICYALGNRHLPIFIEREEVVVPFEPTTWSFLQRGGYRIEKCRRKISSEMRIPEHHY